MFDVSFWELFVCAVIALIVLGPEKLPAVARALGRWTGQARAYMRNLSYELEREVKVADLRAQVEQARRSVEREVGGMRDSVQAVEHDAQKFARELRESDDGFAAPPAAPPPALPSAAPDAASAPNVAIESAPKPDAP